MTNNSMKRVLASLLVISFCSLNSAVLAAPATSHITVSDKAEAVTVNGASGIVSGASGGVVDNAVGGTVELSGTFENNQSNEQWYGGGVVYTNNNGSLVVEESSKFINNKTESHGGAITAISSNVDIQAGSYFEGNGKLDSSTSNAYGGAIYNENMNAGANNTMTIGEGTQFVNNSSNCAGAIYFGGTNTTIEDDVVFRNNTSVGDGGAIMTGSAYQATTLTIGSGTTFDGNKSTSGSGGAIYNFAGLGKNMIVNLEDGVEFTSNSAAVDGGAIYNGFGTGSEDKAVVNTGAAIFTGNEAKNGNGGAIYNMVDATVNVNTTVDGTAAQFDGNIAGTNGGAIYNNGTLTVDNGVLFNNNSAKQDGGAIYNTSDMTVTDATFTGNNATGNGGAIFSNAANSVIEGGSFSGNTSGGQGGAIYAEGNLALDTTNGNISFSNNTMGSDKAANDIYLGSATTAIGIIGTGTNEVSIGSGIAGVSGSTITNQSNLVLESGSVNSGFAGTYTQKSGSTEVNSKFFGGTSDIDGGSFTLNNGATIVSGSTVNVNNGGTEISNAANVVINGSLTDKGTLNNNGSITVSGDNSLLAVGGYTQSESSTLTIGDDAIIDALNVDGILDIASGNLVFEGTGGIASGDVIRVTDDVNVTFAQQSDTVTMDGNGIGVGGGHVAIAANSNFVMDGTDVEVTGNVLTQNIIIKDADISGKNPDAILTIGDGLKDVTLTLSNNAKTSNGLKVVDAATLKLSPNKGSNLIIDAKNEISGTGSVLVDEIIDKVQQSDGTTEVHNGVGTITIYSDNSEFKGSYTQNMGNVVLTEGSKFFNGTNLISGGSLTAQQGAILTATTVNGGVVNLQDGAVLSGELNVETDAGTYGTVNIYNPIKGYEGVETFEGKTIISEGIINDGNLTYVNPDGTEQSIQITDAGLGLFNNTIIDSKDDNTFTLGLTADTGVTHLTLGNGSGIEAGNIILEDGTSLTYKDNAYIQQDSAISVGVNSVLNFDNKTTDIDYNPIISSDDKTASLNKTGDGALVINSTMQDYHGSISATGGSLDLAFVEEGALDFNNIKVENATMHISSDTIVNAANGQGNVSVTNGSLDVDGLLNAGGAVTVDDSKLNVLGDLTSAGVLDLDNQSQLTVLGNTNLSDNFNIQNGSSAVINGDLTSTGDVNISGQNSALTLNGTTTSVDNLILNDGVLNNFTNMTVNNTVTIGQSASGGAVPTINMSDGGINSIVTENTVLNGDINMSFDYDPRSNDAMDQIITNNFTNNGDSSIIISGINFITSPDDYTFNLDGSSLISQGGTGVANLGESQFIANTAIGQYLVTAGANGGSAITGSLQHINPQMYRAQVATVAQYANQLAFNNIIFDHAAIISGQLGPNDDEVVNRFAASNPLFAPYQYSKKDGGIWFKAYGNIENISMTKGLHVDNTAYGAVIGADLPVVKLKDGWKLIPTAYMAYNGGHQNYDFVSMYQNGGQIGAMATAYKGNFFTSLLAYGGGYSNEMNVRNMGYGSGSDTTGNWFAGVASKSAYNIHLPKDFILQPTALVSYNIFGNQSYNSAFGGNLSMNSGYLNGINVAPGVNLIWNKKTFSIYGTAQMVFNIMGGVDGSAGKVTLDDVRMKHPYFEYGLGVVKSFKERLSGFCQFTIRNGGRTGIGFMGGFQYKL